MAGHAQSASGFDPQQWQPVRLRSRTESRSADFPPLDTFEGRGLAEMTDWCERHCREAWFHHGFGEQTVFWFRHPGDAMQFALRWFPYKCL